MESITTPKKVQYQPSKDNPHLATLSVEPCFPGYGSTIGNALRRVLLSSLPGAAVTGFKIKGVSHEFSTVPGVAEDVIELMMNLKSLRFKLFTDEPVRLELSASGEKVATGADIAENADVEVINKDQVVATLSKKDAKLEMELVVEKGMGFTASEAADSDGAEVGLITIDAIFNPVAAVGYKIENVRVGQMTNYERLVMDIETDGSLSPEDAVKASVRLLEEQFAAVGGLELPLEEEEAPEESQEEEKDAQEDAPEEEAEEKEAPKRKPGRPKKSAE